MIMATELDRTSLPNGLQVVIVPDRDTTRVACELQIPGAGGYYDPPDEPGIAEFAAQRLRAGTASRSREQIAQDLVRWESPLRIDTSESSAVMSVFASSTSTYFPDVLRLVADVVRTPTFPPQDVRESQEAAKRDLAKMAERAAFHANEALTRRLYEPHPGQHKSKTPSTIDGFTSERLVAFARERYVPDNTVLVIMGDISVADGNALAHDIFASWPAGWQKLVPISAATRGQGGLVRVEIESDESSAQIGVVTPNRTHADYETLELIQTVLGTYRRPGRLRTLGETYPQCFSNGLFGVLWSNRFGGAWTTGATVGQDSIAVALDRILNELTRLRTELVSADELETARTIVITDALDPKDPMRARMLGEIGVRLLNLPTDYWTRRRERLSAIGAEEVQVCARKYFALERLVVAVAGPGPRLARELDEWTIS